MKNIGDKIKGLKIKHAVEKDIPVLLDFIKQMATYENMLDQVVATEQSLKQIIFDNNRAKALLINLDDVVIGYVIYFFNFSTFLGRAGIYIEDLYINEKYRGKGVGRQAFNTLVHIAKENKCERIEWTCLNWNEPSLNFYKSIGAKKNTEWILHRLDNQEIDKIYNQEF